MGCGPFRDRTEMIQAVGYVIQEWPSSLQTFLHFTFSTSAVIPLIMLLMLVLMYEMLSEQPSSAIYIIPGI